MSSSLAEPSISSRRPSARTPACSPPPRSALSFGFAERLPAWVNSDHLTALGFVALIAAGGAYWYASVNPYGLLLVIPLLVINWFGDSLDGTLARVRNRQRPRYGFYVDHLPGRHRHFLSDVRHRAFELHDARNLLRLPDCLFVAFD